MATNHEESAAHDAAATVQQQVSDAISNAIIAVVQSVAGAAGSAVGANQQTAGAQGTVGGASAQQGASGQATEVSNKVDVSGPEVIESLNLQLLGDTASMSKSNAKLYDVTASALGFATLFAAMNNNTLMSAQADHRDQNHTKQALATTFPFVVSGDAAEESADDTDRS